MHSEPNAAFNPDDPHGFSALGEHHGHHITSASTLLKVIASLVILTALTVAAAQVESYLVSVMGWPLPDWLNAAIALGIAIVKGFLVLSFFMALRYENPLYTIVFLFCMFAFSLFLGLTGMDLNNRGIIDTWKGAAITPGGIGGGTHPASTYHDEEGNKITLPAESYSGPLTVYLKQKYIEQTGITEAEYERRWAEANHIHLHDPAHEFSTPDRSVVRTGLSGALDETAPDHAQAQGEQPAQAGAGH